MTNLVTFTRPYNIKSVKRISDLLLVIKNILRISESKDLISYDESIMIPVRWSIKKNKLVIDRGTDLFRDIEGVGKEDINIYFKKNEDFKRGCEKIFELSLKKEFFNILNKYKLDINENRFIVFRYYIEENILEIMGLFFRCETKKRSGMFHKSLRSILVNSSEEFFEEFNIFSDFVKTDNRVKIRNYLKVYNDFLNYIENNKVKNISEEVLWKDLIKENLVLSDRKIFIELNNEFVNFINFSYLLDRSFTVSDYNNNIIYNISCKENKLVNNDKEEEDKNFMSLLPVIF